MSCLSRIFGLLFALVLGLGSLLLSLALVGRWNELGLAKGAFYSLLLAITGMVCLFLGGALLFGRNRAQNQTPIPNANFADAPAADAPAAAAPVADANFANATFADATDQAGAAPVGAAPAVEVPLDSPEFRIRQLGRARPGWRGNAPQLAQLTNLNLSVAEATARSMAHSDSGVQIATAENGETIFALDVPTDLGA